MSDLINRKAILKNIEKTRQTVQMMDDTHRASIIMNGMYLCEKAVMNQPSAHAQLEIIRCGECKHWKDDHTCREHSLVSPMMANEFCSKAERREE